MQAVLESPAWTRASGRSERAELWSAEYDIEVAVTVDGRGEAPVSLAARTALAATAPAPTSRPTTTIPLTR
jgi:hypothetical protein